jgi:hypothetical protein
MILSRETVDAAIAERIAEDPSFREALLTDPRSALAELSGVPIPEMVRITIHEESASAIHLVIASESSLSDGDLDLVAGGGSWNNPSPTCQSSTCGG